MSGRKDKMRAVREMAERKKKGLKASEAYQVS
jgi:hypothetical protein